MTTGTVEKAARLVHDQRVQAAGVAALYEVHGDHGQYIVTLGDKYEHCTCPAAGRCSHVAAAMLQHDLIGEQRAAVHRAKLAKAAVA